MANKYMNDPDYLFAVLTAIVKKYGGSITLTKEELNSFISKMNIDTPKKLKLKPNKSFYCGLIQIKKMLKYY